MPDEVACDIFIEQRGWVAVGWVSNTSVRDNSIHFEQTSLKTTLIAAEQDNAQVQQREERYPPVLYKQIEMISFFTFFRASLTPIMLKPFFTLILADTILGSKTVKCLLGTGVIAKDSHIDNNDTECYSCTETLWVPLQAFNLSGSIIERHVPLFQHWFWTIFFRLQVQNYIWYNGILKFHVCNSEMMFS